jgi:cytochrome c biogenesis protein CcmG, thiol:disulfide interchange protein DsbE
MKRWLPFLPLAVLALLGVLFAGYALKRDPEVKPEALVGQPAPAVVLPGLEGQAARPLNQMVRGPALVNLFASWCAPCAVEHPELMRLQAAGVRIIGVAYKDEPAASRAFLARLGNPFAEVLVDRAGDAGVEFGVSGVPETFVVDAAGVIVAKHTGPMTRDDADRLLERVNATR